MRKLITRSSSGVSRFTIPGGVFLLGRSGPTHLRNGSQEQAHDAAPEPRGSDPLHRLSTLDRQGPGSDAVILHADSPVSSSPADPAARSATGPTTSPLASPNP